MALEQEQKSVMMEILMQEMVVLQTAFQLNQIGFVEEELQLQLIYVTFAILDGLKIILLCQKLVLKFVVMA